MRAYVRRAALRLARGPLGRYFAGWIFTHMSFVIPIRRLRETDTLMAFHHPNPGYPLHILLVPKRPLGSLTDISPADSAFVGDLVAAVRSLVAEYGLADAGYRLIANGGAYQEMPHLHFHLIADVAPVASAKGKEDDAG
jgi:histidine triad (HIT) family protein